MYFYTIPHLKILIPIEGKLIKVTLDKELALPNLQADSCF